MRGFCAIFSRLHASVDDAKIFNESCLILNVVRVSKSNKLKHCLSLSWTGAWSATRRAEPPDWPDTCHLALINRSVIIGSPDS